jgi:hypothetical protein
MSEPLLFATTFLAVALIGKWSSNLEPRTPNPAPRASRLAPRASTAAGWSCIAAVLTRYEAWPIVAAAIGLAFIVLLRRGMALPAAARAVRGLALWPLWAIAAFLVNSKVTVGSWFVSSGFFIAENPALGHPWLAWTQIWEGLIRLAGPALPWIAVVSALGLVAAFFLPPGRLRQGYGGQEGGSPDDSARATVILVLALLGCAALPLVAYFRGHPVRIRYDVPLVAAAAAVTGMAVALLPRRVRAAVGAIVVAIAVWQARPFDPAAPVVVESQREAPNKAGRAAVTAYLAAHWDGQPILMSMGSLGHYMHDLSAGGFRVRDFVHEGNGEIWTRASRAPRPFVEWMAIEERAEGGDALHWQATHDQSFLMGYARVAEGGGVALYRRF